MRIGIIMAMNKEYDAMLKLLGGKPEGSVGHNHIILCHSGIGKVNAAVKATELINREHPDCIISTGVAGGISRQIKIMDIVAGREAVYHDVWCGEGNEYGQIEGMPARFRSDDRLYHYATTMKSSVDIHGGLICSGDFFVSSKELADIQAHFPEGLACEMETGAIAQVCHIYKVPFLSFRIISDSPGNEGQMQQYNDFWSTLAEKSFRNIISFLESLPESL